MYRTVKKTVLDHPTTGVVFFFFKLKSWTLGLCDIIVTSFQQMRWCCFVQRSLMRNAHHWFARMMMLRSLCHHQMSQQTRATLSCASFEDLAASPDAYSAALCSPQRSVHVKLELTHMHTHTHTHTLRWTHLHTCFSSSSLLASTFSSRASFSLSCWTSSLASWPSWNFCSWSWSFWRFLLSSSCSANCASSSFTYMIQGLTPDLTDYLYIYTHTMLSCTSYDVEHEIGRMLVYSLSLLLTVCCWAISEMVLSYCIANMAIFLILSSLVCLRTSLCLSLGTAIFTCSSRALYCLCWILTVSLYCFLMACSFIYVVCVYVCACVCVCVCVKEWVWVCMLPYM